MRLLLLATYALAFSEMGSVQDWMQQGFYPALLLVLVTASFGIPIPEDIPLIAAGVLLKTHPGIASWEGTIIVGLAGIMTGDLVLYSIGRHWGPGVVNHRSVSWIVTRERFARVSDQFRRHGAWFCFFGRFFMGIRAVMCLTAGATRFPYWRFFIADLAGALLSVPFFIVLGYLFAGMIPTLRAYVTGVQAIVLAGLVVVVIVGIVVYRSRRRRRARASEANRESSPDGVAASSDHPSDQQDNREVASQKTASTAAEPPGSQASFQAARQVESSRSAALGGGKQASKTRPVLHGR